TANAIASAPPSSSGSALRSISTAARDAIRQLSYPARVPGSRPTVEALLERIGQLVAERQELRERGATAEELEDNRQRLASAQWQLSDAVLARHRPDRRHAA